MQSEQQQRIMGYFIEEAKDHLNTIEQGLLNLQGTIEDPEMVNEVFRAAHSVKGGAAMLGLTSVQQAAHRLEDYFKILKECPVEIDQALETLFLKIFDALQALLEQLQGPFGLTNDKSAEVMAGVEPVFQELNRRFSGLMGQVNSALLEDVDLGLLSALQSAPAPVGAPVTEESALQLIFQSEVPVRLREMLQLFKQKETADSRQQLQAICSVLGQYGDPLDLFAWCRLLDEVRRAIANPQNSYRVLAPIVIKEVKQAQELVLSRRSTEILASNNLTALLPLPDVSSASDLGSVFSDLLGSMDLSSSGFGESGFGESDDALSLAQFDIAVPFDESESFAAIAASEQPDLLANDDWFNDAVTQEESVQELEVEATPCGYLEELASDRSFSFESEFESEFSLNFNEADFETSANLDLPIDDQPPSKIDSAIDSRTGPEVGIAELNSLADLFEGEMPNLDLTWQSEESASDIQETTGASEPKSQNADSEFSDLLFDDLEDLDDLDLSNDLVLDDLVEEDLSELLDGSSAMQPEESLPSLETMAVLEDPLELAALSSDEPSEMGWINSVALSPDELVTADEQFTLDLSDDGALSSADPFSLIGMASSISIDQPAVVTSDDPFALILEQPAEFGELDSLGDDSPFSFSGADFFEQPTELSTAHEAAFSLLAEPDTSLNTLSHAEVSNTNSSNDGSVSELSVDPLNFADPSELVLELESSSEESEDWSASLFEEPLVEADLFQHPNEAPQLGEAMLPLDAEPDSDAESEFTLASAAYLAAQADGEITTFDLNNLWENRSEPEPVAPEISEPEAEFPPENFSSSLDFELQPQLNQANFLTLDTSSLDDSSLEEPSTPDFSSSEEKVELTFTDLTTHPELSLKLSEPEPDLEIWVEHPAPEETDADVVSESAVLSMGDSTDEWFTNESSSLYNTESTDVDISDIFATDLGSEISAPLEQFEPAEAEEFIALSPIYVADSNELTEGTDAFPNGISGFREAQASADLEEDFAEFEFELEGGADSGAVAIAPSVTLQPQNSTANQFAELDLFLEAEPISASDPFSLDFGEDLDMETMTGTEEFFSSSTASFNHPDQPDDFSDLDALLGGTTQTSVEAPQTLSEPEQDSFDDLDALLGDANPPTILPAEATPNIPPKSDEFGDLEDLLKDADQTLGGSSANRKATTVPNRRSNRRGVLTDQTMRVSVKHLDNLNNLVGEMVVNRNSLEQAQERLRQFLDNLLYQVQQLSDVGQRMRDLYERSLLESSLLSTRRSYHLKPQKDSGFAAGQSNASGHATGESFDALEMDRFTGFHTLSQEMIELIVRVRESASDIDFVVEESDQVTRNFRQITTQLQEGLTRARMVPFAQTADRLPRGVRDNALKYGKQAELLVEGRDTLIDKMIIEHLYDPMTHLVNNAVAHGVETAAERIAAGKPPLGKIVLRTFHQGNQTIISVSDDGAGIDQERVKSKAIAKGLITAAQAKEMSRMDTYDLLFHHGFSTADQIDDLKGRGVGLDVVRSNLNEIRGVISIDSTVGKGTTFTIRLPLTLSISKALCCISNRARIAFPMDGVEDMLDVPKERVQIDAQGRSCIYWRDALLPFQPLTDLLKHGRILGRGSVYGGSQEDDIISVVVLRSTGNNLALQVDQVLGEQEIVIKQLEGPVPKPIGIAGATVMGDGRIMPIADVLELIDLAEGRVRRDAGSSLWEMEEQLPPEAFTAKTEPTVLIVDDSITVRELLSMTFNKVGYRVEQARDGQEAWEKLRSGLPCDLVFCDIEMPRMDGLELLSRLQKDPSLSHLPIAMLTSRGADRHRQMAVQLGAKGYFTKPYLEEALLDAAQRMLKGEVLVTKSASLS